MWGTSPRAFLFFHFIIPPLYHHFGTGSFPILTVFHFRLCHKRKRPNAYKYVTLENAPATETLGHKGSLDQHTKKASECFLGKYA